MPRKISLSFLGTGAYRNTDYFFPGEHAAETYATPLIQVAVQQYLEQHEGFGPTDRHVLLLSDAARKRNYLAATKPHDAPAEHDGLRAELLKANNAAVTKTVAVPTGHDRDSVIETFDRMAQEVGTGDAVFLDVTHGFRSLPMLALVLGNFLRVAKGAHVRAIYYGAFEDRGEHGGRTPVYDLAYLLELQEWTTAAYGYVEYGFAAPLSKLATRDSAELLKLTQGQHAGAKSVSKLFRATCDFEAQLRTNRGHELQLAEVATAIAEHAAQFGSGSDLERGPLGVLVDRIAAKTAGLARPDDLNWLRAARLAFDDGLIQQACSLLREGMVTYVCKQEGLKYGEPLDRILVEKAFNVTGHNVPRDRWDAPTFRIKDFELLMQSHTLSILYKTFASLTPFRDDLMHSGYYHGLVSNNARPALEVAKGVRLALERVEAVLIHINLIDSDKLA